MHGHVTDVVANLVVERLPRLLEGCIASELANTILEAQNLVDGDNDDESCAVVLGERVVRGVLRYEQLAGLHVTRELIQNHSTPDGSPSSVLKTERS